MKFYTKMWKYSLTASIMVGFAAFAGVGIGAIEAGSDLLSAPVAFLYFGTASYLGFEFLYWTQIKESKL